MKNQGLYSIEPSIVIKPTIMSPFLQSLFKQYTCIDYEVGQYQEQQKAFNQARQYEKQAKVSPNSLYDVAKSIPQRKNQINAICDFILRNQNGSSTPLYLYGNNGCGKTSTVTAILQRFDRVNQGKAKPILKDVQFCYINCMSLKSNKSLYSLILQKLFGLQTHQKCQNILDQIFSGRIPQYASQIPPEYIDSTKILVFDEIDQIIKDEKLMYNLLEWCHYQKSKILMIFITNMADLGSKLPSKHKSRMKLQSVIFKPYTYDQIKTIFLTKFPQSKKFLDNSAISFICRKVARLNSDIRLLQSIYKQSLLADIQSQMITIQDIQKIFLWKDPDIAKYLQPFKYFIRALANADQLTKFDVQLKKELNKDGKPMLTRSQILHGLIQLSDMGLIQLQMEPDRNATFKYDYRGIKVHQKLKIHWMQYAAQ